MLPVDEDVMTLAGVGLHEEEVKEEHPKVEDHTHPEVLEDRVSGDSDVQSRK